MMKKREWADGDVKVGVHAARRVLRELRVQHPTETDIEDLAFLRGAVVRHGPLSGADARLVRRGSRAIITVSQAIEYRPRQRFAIAHELGHLEAHDSKNDINLCTPEQISERYDQGTEREANAFASEFLMPRELWEKRVDVSNPTLDLVSDLTKEFEVSFVAAAIRFVKLTPERCAVVFSEGGRAKWFTRSDDFGYWIQPDTKLDPYTLAYDAFGKARVSSKPESVSASAWLASSRIDDDCDLIEHCRNIPSLDAALSLLWIPTDSEF